MIYSGFISVAGLNNQFEKAKKAFEEVKTSGSVNALTYANFIYAALINRQFEDANEAFEEAKQKGFSYLEDFCGNCYV